VEKAFFKELSQESSSLNYKLQGTQAPEGLAGVPLSFVGETPSLLFDEFFVSPYVSRIASVSMDSVKIDSDDVEAFRNNKLITKWCALPSLNRFTTFKYVMPSKESSLENEIEVALSREGFSGVKIKFDVLNESLVNVLKFMHNKNSSLIIEMFNSEKLEPFLKMLNDAILKMGGISTPIILNNFGYDSNIDLLWKVLSIDNVYADLSALDLTHLIDFIVSAKESVSNWSKKLLFGTNYPFCKIGDAVTALRYLFSSDFVGEPTDLKRILGGNAVGLVPPRYNLLNPSIEEISTLAIDRYSERAAKIFEELLSYFIKRGLVTISSCDFLVRGDDGVIDTSKYFLALRSTKEQNRGVTFLLMKTLGNVPRGALAITVLNPKTLSAFKNRTIENIGANKTMKNLLSQASLISSDEELNKILKMVADALFKTKTIDRNEISIFSLSAAPLKEKFVGMNPKDMKILGVKDNDIILIKPTVTENWYAALVKNFEDASPGELHVNEEIMSNWYVFEGDTARIENYSGKIELLERVDFAVESSEEIKLADFLAKIEGKMDLLLEKLNGFFIGKDMRFILPELFLDFPFIIRPIQSQPELENKKLGIIRAGKTVINFVSEQWVKPYNLLLVINTSEIMKNSDVPIDEFEKIADLLSTIDTKPVEKFEKKIKEGKITKNIAAALIGVSVLKNLSEKSNLNKASVISYSNQSNLFSILEKGQVTPYIDFRSSRKDFSLKVLSSHIVDKCQYPEGKASLKEAGTKVQEFIEKAGDKIPILTIMITPGEKTENLEIFQEIADKDPRIKLAIIQIGKPENENELKRIAESIKGKYIQIEKIEPQNLGMKLISQLTEFL
jgi:predicted TIM-barrel fold metal-dependent hydrolase